MTEKPGNDEGQNNGGKVPPNVEKVLRSVASAMNSIELTTSEINDGVALVLERCDVSPVVGALEEIHSLLNCILQVLEERLPSNGIQSEE